MYSVTKFFILTYFLYSSIDCSNILGIFPMPSKSHHILGVELLKGFAKRGHNVTLISAYGIDEPIRNFKMIEIPELVQYKEENMQHIFNPNVSIIEKMTRTRPFNRLTELFFENQKVQTILSSRDTKFDLVINFMLFHKVFSFFGHIFDAPIIGYVPTSGLSHILNIVGNPSPPAYVPQLLLPFTDEMTFWQRTVNTIVSAGFPVFQYWQAGYGEVKILERFFPTAPPINEMIERMDMIFVNTHMSYESPRPYLPNVIQIGGYHLQEQQKLPEKLKQFLDSSVEGVVYMSFGTNINLSHLPQEIKDVFIEKFSKLKMKVLWKGEVDTLPGKSDNVKLEKWLPQRAVLAHPNVKLFISHGGAGGTVEALYYGVPILCIPFFADQLQNCARGANSGYAVNLQISDITNETFSEAIDEILKNSKYAENIKLKSELFRNQPINPMELAIFWAEHVIKHKGAKHLKSIAAKMPLYQYLLLDVIAFISTIVIVLLSCTYFSVKFILRKIFGKKKKSKTE